MTEQGITLSARQVSVGKDGATESPLDLSSHHSQ